MKQIMMDRPNSEIPYKSLLDKPVLITGGASGIGAALVGGFARAGSKVVFLDIDEDAAEALATSIAAQVRHKPLFIKADIRDIETVREAIADGASTAGGSFRVLVNNAANDERHTIDEVTPDFWRDRMAVNLDHQFFCAQSVAPGMSDGGGGSIINFGSCSWRLGLGGMPAYTTAKAAIEGLTRALARDLGPHGIRVNCVIPGFIKTQRQIDRWLTPELKATVLAGQCLPELILPEDVANLVIFLASDESRMCTSQSFAIDAGWISAGNT